MGAEDAVGAVRVVPSEIGSFQLFWSWPIFRCARVLLRQRQRRDDKRSTPQRSWWAVLERGAERLAPSSNGDVAAASGANRWRVNVTRADLDLLPMDDSPSGLAVMHLECCHILLLLPLGAICTCSSLGTQLFRHRFYHAFDSKHPRGGFFTLCLQVSNSLTLLLCAICNRSSLIGLTLQLLHQPSKFAPLGSRCHLAGRVAPRRLRPARSNQVLQG